MVLLFAFIAVSISLGSYSLAALLFWLRRRQYKLSLGVRSNEIVLAFFHPYCASGGGGERVLWVGIKALLGATNTLIKHIVIYAGEEGLSKADLLKHVQNRFAITFTDVEVSRIHIIKIHSRSLLEAKWYPVGTMLFQSLASMVVGLECIVRFPADVYCDTMGAAFAYPVVHYLTGAVVAAYVHYPIISTDMLNKVRDQRPSYNNASAIASSVTISSLKLAYYQLFALAYSWAGRHAQIVMVNSSWTKQHVEKLWQLIEGHGNERQSGHRRLALVFPPCNSTELLAMPCAKISHSKGQRSSNSARSASAAKGPVKRMILSIGQFRPEKDHMLQIKAMQELVALDPKKYVDCELVIMGSTRHAEDVALLDRLRAQVEQLHLEEHVRFVANAPYADLQQAMQDALIGIHTMWNEHFGISVVEMMAAGLIVVAHKSGGPKMDIIPHPSGNTALASGYLAETPEEYAAVLSQVLDNYDKHDAMRARARVAVERFSDEVFGRHFVEQLESAAALRG